MFGESGWIKTGEKSLTNEYINQEYWFGWPLISLANRRQSAKFAGNPSRPPKTFQLAIRYSVIQFDPRFDLYKHIYLARDTELINQ